MTVDHYRIVASISANTIERYNLNRFTYLQLTYLAMNLFNDNLNQLQASLSLKDIDYERIGKYEHFDDRLEKIQLCSDNIFYNIDYSYLYVKEGELIPWLDQHDLKCLILRKTNLEKSKKNVNFLIVLETFIMLQDGGSQGETFKIVPEIFNNSIKNEFRKLFPNGRNKEYKSYELYDYIVKFDYKQISGYQFWYKFLSKGKEWKTTYIQYVYWIIMAILGALLSLKINQNKQMTWNEPIQLKQLETVTPVDDFWYTTSIDSVVYYAILFVLLMIIIRVVYYFYFQKQKPIELIDPAMLKRNSSAILSKVLSRAASKQYSQSKQASKYSNYFMSNMNNKYVNARQSRQFVSRKVF